MELTDRKKQILKIVVDGYVATAEPVSDSTVIALQGVPGSPEFKANAEWMDFLASYDTAAMAEEAAACLPEKYDLYSASTQDMANELDQITRKYNLRLHTSVTDFDSEDTLYSLLNAEPFLTDCTAVSGYIYEDGSFQAYGTNVSGKSYEYQLGRYVKGAFSEVTLNIGSAEDYEEWIYTTSRGDEVQLAHADGIDEEAGLLVTYQDGSHGVVSSGEVSVRGMYGYT